MNVSLTKAGRGHWLIRKGGEYGVVIGGIRVKGNRTIKGDRPHAFRVEVLCRSLGIEATFDSRAKANAAVRSAATKVGGGV